MNKEIVPLKKTGKFAAQRMIERPSTKDVGKVTLGNRLAAFSALVAPVAVPTAAAMALNPVWGFLAFPVAVVGSLTWFGMKDQKLKAEMDSERMGAYDELLARNKGTTIAILRKVPHRKVVEILSNHGMGDIANQLGSAVSHVEKRAVLTQKQLALASKATIRGGKFSDRVLSIFGKRTAYVDASEIGQDCGFVIEYTYHMMKLVNVRKVVLVNEEAAWEEAFKLSITP